MKSEKYDDESELTPESEDDDDEHSGKCCCDLECTSTHS